MGLTNAFKYFFFFEKKYKKLELDNAADVKSVNDWIKLIKNEYND